MNNTIRKNFEVIKQKSKYEELLDYLSKDDKFWLENDMWYVENEIFSKYNIIFKKYDMSYGRKAFDFSFVDNEHVKAEIKYYFLYNLLERKKKPVYLLRQMQMELIRFIEFLHLYSEFKELKSLRFIEIKKIIWNNFLIQNGIKALQHFSVYHTIPGFFKYFYDTRDETEKDVWYANNIPGVRLPANGLNSLKNPGINFTVIPRYYMETIKRYFRTIIVKHSWSHCRNTFSELNYFFDCFYSNGYSDGFLEDLKREDIEKYILWVNNATSKNLGKSISEEKKNKRVHWIKNFLLYIQNAEYEKAPTVPICKLFYINDAPKRISTWESAEKSKGIPEPIIKQLDNCIDDLATPEYNVLSNRKKWINFYKILRYTGWRGTDVLNIKYDTCLEKIYNTSSNKYEYYLNSFATKTSKDLKIPLLEQDPYLQWNMLEIVMDCISEAKETDLKLNNNPKKYLFWDCDKQQPWSLAPFSCYGSSYDGLEKAAAIQLVIKNNNILDEYEKDWYHFKKHRLRNTRISELLDVYGLAIQDVRAWVGHTSIQMTVHYHNVKETNLYEKMKKANDMDLLKIDLSTNHVIEINEDQKDELIRWHLVRNNLDSVKVPFGLCFKPSNFPCKQQMNHCLSCGSFCTTVDFLDEFYDEIGKVQKQIEKSRNFGRVIWVEKNEKYLDSLNDMVNKIIENKIIHKNGKSREVLECMNEIQKD